MFEIFVRRQRHIEQLHSGRHFENVVGDHHAVGRRTDARCGRGSRIPLPTSPSVAIAVPKACLSSPWSTMTTLTPSGRLVLHSQIIHVKQALRPRSIGKERSDASPCTSDPSRRKACRDCPQKSRRLFLHRFDDVVDHVLRGRLSSPATSSATTTSGIFGYARPLRSRENVVGGDRPDVKGRIVDPRSKQQQVNMDRGLSAARRISALKCPGLTPSLCPQDNVMPDRVLRHDCRSPFCGSSAALWNGLCQTGPCNQGEHNRKMASRTKNCARGASRCPVARPTAVARPRHGSPACRNRLRRYRRLLDLDGARRNANPSALDGDSRRRPTSTRGTAPWQGS